MVGMRSDGWKGLWERRQAGAVTRAPNLTLRPQVGSPQALQP